MSNEVKFTILGIAAWLALIGSLIVLYLVVQASHPQTSPQERAYKACLWSTSADKTDKCKYIEPKE